MNEKVRKAFIRSFIAVFVGLTGLILIGSYASPWVAVGVFLALFGNNIDRSGR